MGAIAESHGCRSGYAQLSNEQIAGLAAEFDKISTNQLLPIAQVSRDQTRAQMDEALQRVLQIPDLTVLRNMLGREPAMTNASLIEKSLEQEESPQLELLLVPELSSSAQL